MVKTRKQTSDRLLEDEQARAIPASSHPPRVCVAPSSTPILKKSHLRPSSSKKRLSFTPNAPQEFHFETSSPSVRRIRETDASLHHDSVILQEHLAHGAQCPQEIGAKEKLQYQSWMGQDFRHTLRLVHHVECEDGEEMGVKRLQDCLRFAESLRRRMEIRRATTLAKLPHELGLGVVQTALRDRRIKTTNLSYQQCCEALERSILKEDVMSMVGDGYEFGRRQVSAADLIEYQKLTNKEMYKALRSSLGSEAVVPKQRVDRLDLLVSISQKAEEDEVKRLTKLELDLEAKRRGIASVELDFNALFHLVFRSNAWEHAYEDVDNTPLLEEGDSQSSSCVIS
ncbi:hypothetical protein BASA81_003900 [Batrachochytrium salamandrivorans]|nr:hypothetical protein BASA81_003900 [Batrachochytrium salamandrivorans]